MRREDRIFLGILAVLTLFSLLAGCTMQEQPSSDDVNDTAGKIAYFAQTTIDMNLAPLSIALIHRIIATLCAHGEVRVVNGPLHGEGHAAYLLGMMKSRLSDEDKAWIRDALRDLEGRLNAYD